MFILAFTPTFTLTMLQQAANKNLLLGFMPESLGLLLFGIGLIASAVGLRRIINRNEVDDNRELTVEPQRRSVEKKIRFVR